MEIFLIIILIIIGLYTALLTGILNSLNQDFITTCIDTNQKKATKIEYIWNEYNRINESFHLLEHFCYLAAAALIGVLFPIREIFGLEFLLIISIYFFLLLIFRSFFYAFGKKISEKFFSKNLNTFILISSIGKPFYYLSDSILKAMKGSSDEDDSREEISAAVETAREEGSLDDDEYRIMKNIMQFSDVLVSDVMTPRTVVYSWNASQTVGDTVNLPEVRMYSRFPIWEGESLDDGVMGYVMSKDILHAALQDKSDMKLRDFRREVYFIPDNAQLDSALDMFLRRRQHLFVVVDEYGGVEGLLTMEDVLETMLGVEIVDEADRFVDMRLLAKQRRDRRISVIQSDG